MLGRSKGEGEAWEAVDVYFVRGKPRSGADGVVVRILHDVRVARSSRLVVR